MARRQAQADLFSRARAAASWKCSREKCSERRRRRIELRRSRSSSAQNLTRVSPEPPQSQCQNPMPVFSAISAKRSVCVEPELINISGLGEEPLHFFAVYHGHASTLYKELLQRFIAEEVTRVDTTAGSATVHDGNGGGCGDCLTRPDRLRTALRMSFERMERVALGACWCVDNEYPCACKPIRLTFGGSAAVVAILTAQHIAVARHGASRAVLCRGGLPISLSHDIHDKPQRINTSDQLERVHESSGRIPYHNGVLRLYGNVDVSSPLEVEILVIERRGDQDECLILGSNGLWDVISEDTACNVTNICLRDGHGGGSDVGPGGEPFLLDDLFQKSKASIGAAALLCRLALGRGSISDSISVIVIDLKRH